MAATGGKRGRPAPAREEGTRARLLEAAVRTIEEAGADAVRVRDVAAAAGVTYASLYHFFGDREGLIAAAQAERYERSMLWVTDAFTEGVRRCRDQQEFRTFCRHTLNQVFDEGNARNRMTRINVLGACQNKPVLAARIADAQARINATLAEIFRGPQLRGWIPAELDLIMLFGLYNGQLNGRVLIEVGPERADGRAWDRIAARGVLAALFGEE